MKNIIDIFNSSPIEFIHSHKWMEIDSFIQFSETRNISIPVTTTQTEIFNIDIESQLVSVIKNEINQDLSKNIFKRLFDTKKFEYLDLRGVGSLMNGRVHLQNLVQMILKNDYKNLVTTGLIVSELQDSHEFLPYMTTHDLKISGSPECCGKLNKKVEIYQDPFMKYNDGRICLFNDVRFNIGEFKAYESFNSMSPGVVIEYKIGYNVGDSKLIFVIEDENSEAFKQYKSLQRDIKIDNVLDVK